MVYERVRGWTSGRSLPVQNFVKYPPPPWYSIVQYSYVYMKNFTFTFIAQELYMPQLRNLLVPSFPL